MPRGRALTQNFGSSELQVLVEEFTCKDASVKNQVAVHRHSENRWRLRGVELGEPLDHTDEFLRQSEEISLAAPSVEIVAAAHGGTLGTHLRVNSDEQTIFPAQGSQDVIWEDFRYEWNFRGTLAGLHLVADKERWIPGALPTETACQPMEHAIQDTFLGSSPLKSLYEIEVQGRRLPAVLTKQRLDGFFEVVAFQPDEYGIVRNVEYPCVARSEIFPTGASEPVKLPERLVALDIRKENALDMNLQVDGKPFLECLGRFSAQSRRICMEVPRRQQQLSEHVGAVVGVVQDTLSHDGSVSLTTSTVFGAMKEGPITADCGAAVLRHFLSGEVRMKSLETTRLSKQWGLQLGPFAQHVIQLTKSRFSRILTLKVDGSVLAECTGKELGCAKDEWRCRFRFLGQRCIDFNVHPETKNGIQLADKRIVTKTLPYEHVIEVVYHHRTIDDLASAELSVDGVTFSALPVQVDVLNEPNMAVTREVLALSYGLEVPKKVLAQDTRATAHKVADRVWNQWKDPLTQKVADAGALMSAHFTKLQQAAWSAIMPHSTEEESAEKSGMDGSKVYASRIAQL